MAVVTIGTKVPSAVLSVGTIIVRNHKWSEFGTRVSGEKSDMLVFENEPQYWEYMRSIGKKSSKTKNEDGSVSRTKLGYMPRYEAVGLASYDAEPLTWYQMKKGEDGKFRKVRVGAESLVVRMNSNNIYVQRSKKSR